MTSPPETSTPSATRTHYHGSCTFEPIGGRLGAVVHGLGHELDLDDRNRDDLRLGLLAYKVLILREQIVSTERLRFLAEIFGTLRTVTDGPTETIETIDASQRANVWHTDLTYLKEPNVATVMQLTVAPPAGGDTAWSSMSDAYTSLSPALRSAFLPLHALHRDPLKNDPPVLHPMVRRHPVTGAKSLYVNRYYTSAIADVSDQESRSLLSLLFGHAESIHHTCRWSWAVGDISVWDNTCTIHIGVDDYPRDSERRALRASVSGDTPLPAS